MLRGCWRKLLRWGCENCGVRLARACIIYIGVTLPCARHPSCYCSSEAAVSSLFCCFSLVYFIRVWYIDMSLSMSTCFACEMS